MEYRDYKNLTKDQREFWQFEQLACIGSLKEDIKQLNKRMNFAYAWATGVAAGVSFIFMFVKTKFFD